MGATLDSETRISRPIIFSLLVSLSCAYGNGLSAETGSSVQIKSAFPSDTAEFEAVIRELPELHQLWADENLRRQFDRYMRWLASSDIASPDAVYLMDLVDRGVNAIDLLSQIFHEMVEFKNWIRLGHTVENIMILDYYQSHYPLTYPVAHCNAVLSQALLLNAFAKSKGVSSVPMLAYDLVSPDYERREGLRSRLPIPMLVRQLRYNLAEFDQDVTVSDIKTALAVFEKGGYSYRDSSLLLSSAKDFMALSRQERIKALKLEGGISSCQSLPRR